MIKHHAPDPRLELHLDPNNNGDLYVVINGKSHVRRLAPRHAIMLLALIEAWKSDQETDHPRNGWRTRDEIGAAYGAIADVAAPGNGAISHYFSDIKRALLSIDVEVFQTWPVFETWPRRGYHLTRNVNLTRTRGRSS